MFKILSTYKYLLKKIYIKCNIWRVAVRPSFIKDAGFFKVKGYWEGQYDRYKTLYIKLNKQK
jgi:hypothetical protein